MRRLDLLLLTAISLFTACAPSGPHKPVNEGAADTHGATSVSYDELRPVFARNCAACHPARSGPDWLDYAQAHAYIGNGKLERRAVRERSMPPPGSPQAAAMTDADRDLIEAWVRGGGAQHAGAPSPRSSAPSPQTQVSHDVQQCVQCHGTSGPDVEAQPKIPRLNGQNEIYILGQLNAFRWRQRVDPSNAMNDIASGLSDAAMAEAAHYYATQSGLALAAPPPVSEDLRPTFQRGMQLAAERCTSCHMNPGASDPSLPLLAGQAPQYLINQMLYFRNGERTNPLMKEFARVLSDDDIRALAVFFSGVH